MKILFILREPNSNGKETDSFWVWEKLHDRPDSVYIPSLETIAGLLIEDSYKDKHQKLKQCAYMNLYPHSGKGSIGETYEGISMISVHEGRVELQVHTIYAETNRPLHEYPGY